MVRTPSIDKNGIKRGAWSEDEDNKLRAYVERSGHPNWRQLPKHAGLMRCGKSCRLRWMNYLRPGLKKGNYSHEEEELIIKLHKELGNRWSVIAARLPGRSDNDVKNQWHAHLKKRVRLTNCINNSSTVGQYTESSQSRSLTNGITNSSTVEQFTESSQSRSLTNGITNSSTVEQFTDDQSPQSGSSQNEQSGMGWIEEESMEHLSIFTSLELDSFSWTNPIDNFQTESFDPFWSQPFDNFWTGPFF